MREAVNLTKVATRKANGRKYTYWVLRWHAPNGRQCSKSIGRVGQMSRRRAEKLRRAKQAELDARPERRAGTRVPDSDASVAVPSPGERYVQAIAEAVGLQTAGQRLTEREVDILRSWLELANVRWLLNVQHAVIDFLAERPDDPAARELLAKYQAAFPL